MKTPITRTLCCPEKQVKALYRTAKFLDNGSFGRVYKINNKRVVKTFRDKAYTKYVEYILRNPKNKHFPQIFHYQQFKHGACCEYGLVELELLHPITDQYINDKMVKDFLSFLWDGIKEEKIEDLYGLAYSRAITKLKTLQEKHKLQLDIAPSHNVMLRKGAYDQYTLVFTDPFCE